MVVKNDIIFGKKTMILHCRLLFQLHVSFTVPDLVATASLRLLQVAKEFSFFLPRHMNGALIY